MAKNNRFKRGFTLIELTVVLSVVAIITVMVVTFSTLTAKKVNQTTRNLNFMQDVVLVNTLLDTWVEQHLQQGSTLTVTDGVLTAELDGTPYGITLQNGTLRATCVTNDLTANVQYISGLTFELAEPNAQGNVMYFCTASYDVDGVNGNYVFTINPHVGDVIRGV